MTTDGDFGKTTLAAVKEFQSKHGLAADGVVGPATINALCKANLLGVTDIMLKGAMAGLVVYIILNNSWLIMEVKRRVKLKSILLKMYITV